MLRVVVCVISCLWARSAGATGERPLSLGEVIQLAVRQNPLLAASKLDVAIARAHVTESLGIEDVIFGASAGWQRDTNDYFGPMAIAQTPYDTFGGGIQLSRALPTGGRLSLTMRTDYTLFHNSATGAGALAAMQATASDGMNAVSPSSWLSSSVQLQLWHPLLRGAGLGVFRAEIRRARANHGLAELQRESLVAKTLADVSTAYWDLYYATAQRQIARSSLELAEQQLRAVRANIELGKESPSGAAEVEVAIALRRAQVIEAETSLRESSLTLQRLIGLPVEDAGPPLAAADVPDVRAVELRADAAVQAALDGNPDLLALGPQRRVADIDVAVADNRLLPQLDLSVSGGPAGNSSQPSTAYSQLAHFDGYTALASLTLTESFQRRAEKGQAERAHQTRQKLALTETDLKAQIRAAVLSAMAELDSAARRSDVLQQGTRAATLDLESVKARFQAGRASNFDVLRRQDGLATAQLREASARADYEKALVTVEKLTNEIFQRYGIAIR